MKDDKLILELETPENGYAAETNKAFENLIEQLNAIHARYDSDESKTEEQCEKLDRWYSEVEELIAEAYTTAMVVNMS